MNRNWKLLLYGFVLLMQACIETVDPKFQQSAPVTVLNCMITPERDTVFAWISESQTLTLNDSFKTIENAKVDLFENDTLIGRFSHIQKGKYALPFTVRSGKTYRMEAQTESKTLWAETTVPGPIHATFNIGSYNLYSESHRIVLNDQQNETNYYWATAIDSMPQYGPWGNASIIIYSNYELADDFNQNVELNGNYRFYYDYYLRFTDSHFNGQQTEIIFKPNGRPHYSILMSTDQNLDNYMKSSYKLFQMNQYSEDMPMIYVPFPVYSNINGGTGIFGSYSLAWKKITTEDNE